MSDFLGFVGPGIGSRISRVGSLNSLQTPRSVDTYAEKIRIPTDRSRYWHEPYFSDQPTVIETELSGLSAGHKIGNTLSRV